MSRLRAAAAAAVDTALELTIAGSFTAIGYRARSGVYGWSAPAGLEPGTTAVVTGATSGLGRATASALAAAGARVVILGRDEQRTSAAAEAIRTETGGALDYVVADLADLASVRGAADVLRERLDRLDVLINNAGALTHRYTVTADGLELTYQTHVVAPFLLTEQLLPLLSGTRGSRVVTVSSGGMYTEALNVEKVQMRQATYDGVTAYARAKRAQVVLNEQWAQRVSGAPVFHAMHPGWADTPGVVDSLPTFHKVTGRFLRTPQQGADTIVWLATADEPADLDGLFWLDRRPRSTSYLPGTRTDAAAAIALWERVSADAGISAPVP